nr:hypothetical protein [Mycobacterium lepraemurium]
MLTLESDLDPQPELYLESAWHAMTLLDLELADRLANAAARAGVPGAAGARAMNLVLLGRVEQAEEALRAITDGADSDASDRHYWATVRAANLVWMLGRPADAALILDGLAARPETLAQACLDAVAARCQLAAERARAALDSESLPDFHAMMASLALIMAMGALGQVDDLTAVAEQALRRATTSSEASHMRFWFGAVYGRACRLTGYVDEFVSTAIQLADSARDVPDLAYANLALLLGNAELARGAAAEAARLVQEALAGAQIHEVTSGLRPASYFALAEAHGGLGHPTQANEAIAGARSCVPPDFLFMHTGQRAGGGAARPRPRPAHPRTGLHPSRGAMGGRRGAARARALADALSLPLADAIACHAEALWAGNGEALLTAAAAYRAIDDAAAADAAAQASAAFVEGQQHQRGRYAAALAGELVSWPRNAAACARRRCGPRRGSSYRAGAMSSNSSWPACPTARSPSGW